MNVVTLEKKIIEAENKLHTGHGGNLNYSRFRDLKYVMQKMSILINYKKFVLGNKYPNS